MDKTVDSEQKIALLKKQPVFSQLTPQETEELAQLLIEKHFEPGDRIVTEGDPVDSVYLIVKGQADVQHIRIVNNEEDVTSVAKLHAGESIGLNESGFYSVSGVRTATVVADTKLILLYLSLPAFHGFALMNHHVSEVMRRNAAKMLMMK